MAHSARALPAAAAMLVAFTGAAVLPPATAHPAAEHKPVLFPNGVWKGAAVLSGTMKVADVSFDWEPSAYTFTVTISNGTADGTWVAKGGELSAVDSTGEATGTWHGSGVLHGTATRIVATGSSHVHEDVTAEGLSFPVDLDVPDHYTFSAAGGSCVSMSGDVLQQARATEQAKGFSSTVKGLFVAQKVAGVTSTVNPNFTSKLTALMSKASELEKQAHPSVAAIQALIGQISSFYDTAMDWSKCDGPPATMGKHGSSRLLMVQIVGVLVLKALDQGVGLTPLDVMDLADAASRIGAIGANAPYPGLAKQLTADLTKAISTGLTKAAASGDKNACGQLGLAAESVGGLSSQVAKAQACLTS